MSDPRRDADYLGDIMDAILRIQEYTGGISWDEFLADIKTQDAVVRNLEVIGEAVKNLSDALKTQHAQVPWRDMAAVRDRLIHHYFGVNNEIVWQIIQEDLPLILPKIENVLGHISD
jgi:uncharacterized protein with HEPN domain